jgi:hypothetical protein
MTKDEALKLALEGLEAWSWDNDPRGADKYITAIKEALAQPEQPKVRTGDCLLVGVCASEGHKIQPQRTWSGLTYEDMTKLQKDLYDAKGESVLPTTFAMAVEAKLKEKNT